MEDINERYYYTIAIFLNNKQLQIQLI